MKRTKMDPLEFIQSVESLLYQRETLSDIGTSHPPPGSSEVFPSEAFPDELVREALCCKIGGEYAKSMHCLLYGGVAGVNSTDTRGFKRHFKDAFVDCRVSPQSF